MILQTEMPSIPKRDQNDIVTCHERQRNISALHRALVTGDRGKLRWWTGIFARHGRFCDENQPGLATIKDFATCVQD